MANGGKKYTPIQRLDARTEDFQRNADQSRYAKLIEEFTTFPLYAWHGTAVERTLNYSESEAYSYRKPHWVSTDQIW